MILGGTKQLALMLALAALAIPVVGLAAKKLNAGSYWNTNYQTTYTGSKSFGSTDGRVTVTMDNIETINCSGCDTVHYFPGNLFHARNTSKKPVCFAFSYDLKAGAFNGVDSWGSGQIFLLKPRQSIAKFAGITMSFSRSKADLSWSGYVDSWDPIDKKNCGANPFKK